MLRLFRTSCCLALTEFFAFIDIIPTHGTSSLFPRR